MEEKKYCVYKHTTPANKYYFGITSYNKDKNLRWRNGMGYRTQTVFFNAIVKYGWDNIKHEIVEDNLTLDEAIKKERYYIEKYKTNVSEYKHEANGYNMTAGGETFPLIDKCIREKIYAKTRKPIDCYDVDGKFIKTYDSAAHAANELKISVEAIRQSAHGKTKICKRKYRFVFHNNKIPEITGKLYERHVYMFDFYGNYIMDFNSCSEASRYIVGDNSASSIIAHCARGERGSFHQYTWSYSKVPNLLTRAKYRNRKVDMLDNNGNVIKTFDSISAATREVNPNKNVKSSTPIRNVCEGIKKIAFGYHWKYHDDEVNRITNVNKEN